MPHAHDGAALRPVATVRAGDGSFLFLARPATDFADTGGIGPYEALLRPPDLGRWVRAATGLTVNTGPADLDAARLLRAAIWRLCLAVIAGRPLDPAAVGTVNAAAALPDLAPQLAPDGTGWLPPAGPAAVLSWVARDTVAMLAGDRTRLRQCQGVNCALLFHDDSRSAARRWCAPERCGDRTRSREYRRRKSDRPDLVE